MIEIRIAFTRFSAAPFLSILYSTVNALSFAINRCEVETPRRADYHSLFTPVRVKKIIRLK